MSDIKVGDKFVLEIEAICEDNCGDKFYKIKNFKCLMFDEAGLLRLKKVEPVQLYKDTESNQSYWISNSEIENIDKVIRYVYHSDKDENSAIEIIKK